MWPLHIWWLMGRRRRRRRTLMWSSTAVATLVCRSMSRFFSSSSGRELRIRTRTQVTFSVCSWLTNMNSTLDSTVRSAGGDDYLSHFSSLRLLVHPTTTSLFYSSTVSTEFWTGSSRLFGFRGTRVSNTVSWLHPERRIQPGVLCLWARLSSERHEVHSLLIEKPANSLWINRWPRSRAAEILKLTIIREDVKD